MFNCDIDTESSSKIEQKAFYIETLDDKHELFYPTKYLTPWEKKADPEQKDLYPKNNSPFFISNFWLSLKIIVS